MDDPRFRVCLDREVVLAPVSLAVREWPGQRGPLLISEPSAVPDPSWLAPRWRVLSVESRADVPLHVRAWDIVGLLDQFGFLRPVLLGSEAALVLAARHPERLAGLVLVEPNDCEADIDRLRARVTCPLLNLRVPVEPALLEAFLDGVC